MYQVKIYYSERILFNCKHALHFGSESFEECDRITVVAVESKIFLVRETAGAQVRARG